MTKIIVKKDLGMWLKNNANKISNRTQTFNAINNLMVDYNSNKFEYYTMVFISKHIDDIIEVIKGEREYEIEKEEFYALIKGYEKVQGTVHWAYNEMSGELKVNYYSGYQEYNIKMTKDGWEELGINDSNAHFSTTLD